MITNIEDKIELIKNLCRFINCCEQLFYIITTNSKKPYIKIQYNYYLSIIIYFSKKIIENLNYILYIFYNFKKYFKYILKFIKFLFIYLIEKYYYKISNIDFIIKTLTNKDAFNFFIYLNKLKKILTLYK